MNEDALSGRALDAAIAVQMGARLCEVQRCRYSFVPDDPHWHEGNRQNEHHPPRYSDSLDALSAGPEALLRAAGWSLTTWAYRHGAGSAWWSTGPGTWATPEPISGATEAEARARAALAALRVLATAHEETK